MSNSNSNTYLGLNSIFQTVTKQAYKLAHPHYAVEAILCLFFILTKHTPVICSRLYSSSASHQNRFDPCKLDWREREILIFVAIIITFKARKCPTWLAGLKLMARFVKLTNLAFLIRTGPSAWPIAVLYALACLAQFLFLPEPFQTCDQDVVNKLITNYRGPHLGQELEKLRRIKQELLAGGDSTSKSSLPNPSWLIEFYAPWSPPCHNFAPVFATLAQRYASQDKDGLRFGRMDVSRWPEISLRDFAVDASATSRQLPTLILYEAGFESIRRPEVKGLRQQTQTSENQSSMATGLGQQEGGGGGWIKNWAQQAASVVPFVFSYDNVVQTFNLEAFAKREERMNRTSLTSNSNKQEHMKKL